MEGKTAQNEKKIEMKNDFWKELFKLLIIALVVVVPFRLYIAQPFIVDGASMDPTFATGQYLIVDELTYHFKAPERGSVIIFKYPNDTTKFFIKRIIGFPGETVVLKNGVVTIINSTHPNGFILNEPYVKLTKSDNASYTLDTGDYFVLGDNRFGSADSRIWGPLPSFDIVGRPILRVWPFSIWPGDETSLASENANVQTN
jgi:signal peptidase I